MAIMRWDPFRELEQVQRDLERIWSGPVGRRLPWRGAEMTEAWVPAFDVWETNDAVMVRAALPGVRPEDLQVTVADNAVTIRGEMRRQETNEGDRFHRQEIQYGTYQGVITLPPYANTEQIEANYENGVLTLRLPKREQARARQIPVRVTGNNQTTQGQQRSIEGRSEPQQPGQPRPAEGRREDQQR